MSHFYRPPRARNPSRKQIRNQLRVMQAMATGAALQPLEPTVTRPRSAPKKQRESHVNDAIIRYMRAAYRASLMRNRRGMVQLPGGGMFPYGLGENGFPDDVGPTPVVITASMVGKTVGVFTAIEAKTDTGTVEAHQIECMERLRDLGCIVGVARESTVAEDCEAVVRRWLDRVKGDER